MSETTGGPKKPPNETPGGAEKPPTAPRPVFVPQVLSPALRAAGQVAKRAVEGPLRTWVAAVKFTLAAVVCLLLGFFIAPYLSMSVITTALFFYPLMFIGGGIAGMVLIPMNDVFTSSEVLALKRAEFLHGEQTKILDGAATRLRESGQTPQEIGAQQREQREQNDQQYLQALKQLNTASVRRKSLQINSPEPDRNPEDPPPQASAK